MVAVLYEALDAVSFCLWARRLGRHLQLFGVARHSFAVSFSS